MKRMRLLWLVGFVGLALSMGVAGWTYHARAGAESSPAMGESASVAAAGPQGVVCFGHVDVESGVASLYPVQGGRVVEVLVKDTDVVPANAVLLRLDDRQAKYRVQQAEAECKAAQAQLAEVRQLPRHQQEKLAQQQAAVDAVHSRLSAARHIHHRKQHLQQLQQVSSEESRAAGDAVKELEAVERAEQAKLRELRLSDPALDIARAEAALAGAEARAQEARQAVEECLIRAPTAGEVLRVMVSAGDVLQGMPRQPAVLFCPQQPRLIRAEVEQEFAGLLAIGQSATIQDDTLGGATWRGKVTRISGWYTQRRSTVQEPLQHNDVRTLECLIAVEPEQAPLRIGQRVRVRLERVRR